MIINKCMDKIKVLSRIKSGLVTKYAQCKRYFDEGKWYNKAMNKVHFEINTLNEKSMLDEIPYQAPQQTYFQNYFWLWRHFVICFSPPQGIYTFVIGTNTETNSIPLLQISM